MNKQTMIGGSLVTVAFFMFVSGIGDQLEHLQNFDGLTIAQSFGTVLKHGSEIALGVLGGTLIKTPGSQVEEPLSVNLGKVGQP